MKPYAPILCFGLVAALSVACQPVRPTTQAPFVKASTFPSCERQGITDGTAFVKIKVALLPSNFNPQLTSSTSPAYRQPVGDNAVGSGYSAALIGAFNIAPQFFKEELCGLTKVFINLNPCQDTSNCTDLDAINNSWGYRERPDQFPRDKQPTEYSRYVATSALLWKGGQPPKFSVYETKLLNGLLLWPGNSGPQYDYADPDTPEMTVLAALAHEFGHVLWYDVNNPDHNPTYNPNDLYCTLWPGAGFFEHAWQPVSPPPSWRYFRATQGAHNDGVQVDDILKLVNPGPGQRRDLTQAARLLDKVYSADAPWSSLFAAFSPDEDFIETYKFFVLTQKPTPKLQHLRLNIPNVGTEDIPKDLVISNSKAELRRKNDCFGP